MSDYMICIIASDYFKLVQFSLILLNICLVYGVHMFQDVRYEPAMRYENGFLDSAITNGHR